MISCLFGWAVGYSNLLLLPFATQLLTYPRRMSVTNFFTFHAELLPHTEQVVFHKSTLFGKVRRVFVDIKNLEKIDAEIIPSSFLFKFNMFDPNMVFRD